jgi:cyclase
MLAKRIIPCLDVRDGKVVKGIHFVDIKEVGDPVACAVAYDRQNADEIVFLDITATHEGRGTMADVVRRTARHVFVPLTVGGGIRSVEDFRTLLLAGADKVSVNSAAIRNPELISEAAARFGSQCVVVAIDARRRRPEGTPGAAEANGAAATGADGAGPVETTGAAAGVCPARGANGSGASAAAEDPARACSAYSVFVNGGRIDTGIDAVAWAREAARRGAGEILLTSMDTDGTKNGFDVAMLNAVCSVVNIPVIASGGGGKLSDFVEVFQKSGADAALAASVFHYGELSVDDVKRTLAAARIPVRFQE